ncbi:oxidoreductase [Tardiphaga sp. 42S5]|uniref:oxidoreductase n=1 Tax=Tardiphaga sp. 42S5 TaxID=1404799 RepID=UPI002A5A1741|nr:oxidoreductase [Tardiphaga sp. 42S5]WPO43960.1 oxidoreductase [Tardiphaga sp. 42S5]
MTRNGKVALVTGASSGIGKASTAALRDAGFHVFGTSRRPSAQSGDAPAMLSCDVTDDASVAECVRSVIGQAGRLDVLVNNAGHGLTAGAEESTLNQTKALFDVNFFGVVRMTNAALPFMREQNGGRIINVSSVLGFIPSPYSALYSATKHALEGYSESLDHELRPFGIRVSLLEPAYTRTSFEENTSRPDRPLQVYEAARQNSLAKTREIMKTAEGPGEVGRMVVEAATAAVPRRRYACGKEARKISLLRRFVPPSLFDRSLRKQFGLPDIP